MLRFSIWLLGALIIAATFLSLALVGALSGNSSFLIGWAICGVYSVVMFCGIGGQPENVGGTSIFMILGGALTLLFVLGLTAQYERWHSKLQKPGYRLLFDRQGRPYYVQKS